MAKIMILLRYTQRLWPYIRKHMPQFVIGFILMILVSLSQLAGPLILRHIIDVSMKNHDTASMLHTGLLYVAVIILMGIFTYFQTVIIAKLGLHVVIRIKNDIFKHLLELPVSFFDTHQVGELMARVESDTERVKELFSRVVLMIINNALFFIGMFIIFYHMNPVLATYLLIPVPFIMTIVFMVFGYLRKYYKKIRVLYAEITGILTEYMQGIFIVQLYNRAKHVLGLLDKKALEKRGVEVKASLLEYSFFGFLHFLIGTVLVIVIIQMLSPGIIGGVVSLGTLVVFLDYSRRLFEPLMAIAENIRSMQQASVSLKRIFDILDIPSEHSQDNPFPVRFENEIRFENVTFAYKEDEPVLRNVSFTIPKGATIALVGPSGSGKTTTISLLTGFYPISAGSITVDGVPLQQFDLHEWRRHIGLVLQDIYLFPGNILENIRVYDDTITQDNVENAVRTVHAEDFLARLDEGLMSELHERGQNISMGEKQLLSFARALAFSPDIIVMDEATASIDVNTEKKIQDSMHTLLRGKTAVIVAHRLSSIMNADMILVFKDGEIIARGTHNELLSSCEDYANLVRLQFMHTNEPVLE